MHKEINSHLPTEKMFQASVNIYNLHYALFKKLTVTLQSQKARTKMMIFNILITTAFSLFSLV